MRATFFCSAVVLLAPCAHASMFDVNNTGPSYVMTARMTVDPHTERPDMVIQGWGQTVDAYFPLFLGAAPLDVSDECDARTFWVKSPAQTTADKDIALSSIFTVFVCGAMRESSMFFCNYESAGFLAAVFVYDASMAPLTQLAWGPGIGADCTCGWGGMPSYSTAFLRPLKFNGIQMVLGMIANDAGATVNITLQEAPKSEYSFLAEMNEPYMYAIFRIGIAISVLQFLYTCYVCVKMKKKLLSWPGVAIICEGIFAASIRGFKGFFEPLFYTSTVGWKTNGILYYLDMIFSNFANAVIMSLFMFLASGVSLQGVRLKIFHIVTFCLSLGFSVPLFIAMFEWSYMFHGKDITYISSGALGTDVGLLNNRLRFTYFGFLVVLIVVYFVSSLMIVVKLLKAGQGGSAAGGSKGSKMLKYIVAQALFFCILAAVAYIDAVVQEDVDKDDATGCVFTFLLKSITCWVLGFLQVMSLYDYAGGSSSSSSSSS